MIRLTFGSPGLAAYRHRRLLAELGPDHPATRAALGRLRYHRGDVPQRGASSVEAIAWYRESGAIDGYWNRAQRAASLRPAGGPRDGSPSQRAGGREVSHPRLVPASPAGHFSQEAL